MNLRELSIRKAMRADAQAIHDLHTVSATTLCRTHYALDLIQRWIEDRTPEGYFEGMDRGDMFVCEIGDTMVGFGHAVPGEIVALFVHPDYARQGIGSALLSHAIAMAQRNHPGPVKIQATLNAQPFYEQHGFVETKRFAVPRNDVEVPIVEMELRA